MRWTGALCQFLSSVPACSSKYKLLRECVCAIHSQSPAAAESLFSSFVTHVHANTVFSFRKAFGRSFSEERSLLFRAFPNCVAISFRISLTSRPIDCSQCNRWIDQIANYDFWNVAASERKVNRRMNIYYTRVMKIKIGAREKFGV